MEKNNLSDSVENITGRLLQDESWPHLRGHLLSCSDLELIPSSYGPASQLLASTWYGIKVMSS